MDNYQVTCPVAILTLSKKARSQYVGKICLIDFKPFYCYFVALDLINKKFY